MNDAVSPEDKQRVKTLLDAVANAAPDALRRRLEAAYHPDAHWRGSHPLNELRGVDAIEEKAWRPLLTALPDLERRDDLLIGGRYQGRNYVGMVGHYAGAFERDWLDIPATGQLAYLRYGEFHQLEDGKIVQSTVLLDLLDLMRQAGFWPLPPSLGLEAMWPGPISGDGVNLNGRDKEAAAASLELCLAMQKSLDNELVERADLLNMAQKKYWHPKMMWHGPSGIGACRGLKGFVDGHQRPFRLAFPVRHYGNSHYVRIGDGRFAATAGWPSVTARHEGHWLGAAPTGREIKMRVMDFYLCDEGRVRENWVPIDVIDIQRQMGVDLMAKLRQWRAKTAGRRRA